MKNLWIVCLLLIASFCTSASPNANTDSLKQLLPRAKPAAQSAIMHSLAKIYEDKGDHSGMLAWCRARIRVVNDNDLKSEYADAYAMMGNAFMGLGVYDKALEAFTVSLACSSGNDPKLKGYTFQSIGRIYEIEGISNLASENLTESFNIFRQLNDAQGMAECQVNLGGILLKQKKYAPAMAAYGLALKLYTRLGDHKNMIGVINNIGMLEEARLQYAKASLYYRKGIMMAAEQADSSAAVSLFINQGGLLLRSDKFAEAKSLLTKGIRLARKSGSKEEQIRGMQTMADLLYKQGKYKDAFNYLKHTSLLSMSISASRNKQAADTSGARSDTNPEKALIQNTGQVSLPESPPFRYNAVGIGSLIILAIITGMLCAFLYLRSKYRHSAASLLNEKNLEIERHENELKVLNTDKEKIFSIITQDLLKPFKAVLGFADVLKEDYENIADNDKILYVRAIHASAFNIYELLKNLLAWSRTQTGALECRPSLIDLSQLTEQNVSLFSGFARNKDIHLDFEISGEAVIYADRNMVSTVIRNLLNNAIELTSTGGEVHVTVKDVDHNAELSITDTGAAAIKPEKLSHPEQPSRSSDTTDESGNDLRIILCRDYISRNNGTLRAESDPGKGNRFTISLPVRSPESVQ